MAHRPWLGQDRMGQDRMGCCLPHLASNTQWLRTGSNLDHSGPATASGKGRHDGPQVGGWGVGQRQATPWPRGEGPRVPHVTCPVCPAPTSGYKRCTKAGTISGMLIPASPKPSMVSIKWHPTGPQRRSLPGPKDAEIITLLSSKSACFEGPSPLVTVPGGAASSPNSRPPGSHEPHLIWKSGLCRCS